MKKELAKTVCLGKLFQILIKFVRNPFTRVFFETALQMEHGAGPLLVHYVLNLPSAKIWQKSNA